MTVYERFSELLQKKGARVADVTKATQISSTVFSEWKKGKAQPKADKLQKIADYFDVSMEYLLTGKELEPFWDGQTDAPTLTIEELQLLELFRTLPDAKRSEIIQYCKFLSQEEKRYKKKSSASSKEA